MTTILFALSYPPATTALQQYPPNVDMIVWSLFIFVVGYGLGFSKAER